MASDWVSGSGAGSGDISVIKTSSCSIMELSPSSIGGDADLGGGVRDISGRTTEGFGGMNKDSVASSSVSLQLAVGVGSPSLSGEPGLPPSSCSEGGDALGVGESGFSGSGSTGDDLLDGVDALLGEPGGACVGVPGGVRVSARAVRRLFLTPATFSLRSATPLLLAAPDSSCNSLV